MKRIIAIKRLMIGEDSKFLRKIQRKFDLSLIEIYWITQAIDTSECSSELSVINITHKPFDNTNGILTILNSYLVHGNGIVSKF